MESAVVMLRGPKAKKFMKEALVPVSGMDWFTNVTLSVPKIAMAGLPIGRSVFKSLNNWTISKIKTIEICKNKSAINFLQTIIYKSCSLRIY